jgi:cytidine deaminase
MKWNDPTVQEMLRRARSAAEHAYCPYSGFRVGAAVLAAREGEEGGELFAGCNVENASYDLTICAERSAVVQAVSAGYRRLLAVVVYTPTETPTAPCGACRQVLFEFGADARVFSFAASGRYSQSTVHALLPDAFGPSDLE